MGITFFKGKIRQDLSWNFLALGVVAVSGLTFNTLAAFLYDASTLGIINQVFALYIVFAQLGTLGVQFSSQQSISAQKTTHEKLTSFNSAFVLAPISGIGTSLLLFFLASAISQFLNSPDIEIAIKLATPGLFFFCINKIILGGLNGFRHMKSFAFLQGIRGALLPITLSILYFIKIPGPQVSIVFSIVETSVFVAGLILLIAQNLINLFAISYFQITQHLKFGLKSMLSGVLIEFNTRIDVLMLGYFLTDSVVGIYSLAATFAEGFSLLLTVFRNNFNPILSESFSQQKISDLRLFVKKWVKKIYLSISLLSTLAILVYFFASKIVPDPTLIASVPFFITLVLGITLCAGYFPFLATLIQIGHPGSFSLAIAVGVLFNILFNLVLIPLVGGIGAALGTSLANISGTIFTIWLTNKKAGFKIL